jgi:hypothetical protein
VRIIAGKNISLLSPADHGEVWEQGPPSVHTNRPETEYSAEAT